MKLLEKIAGCESLLQTPAFRWALMAPLAIPLVVIATGLGACKPSANAERNANPDKNQAVNAIGMSSVVNCRVAGPCPGSKRDALFEQIDQKYQEMGRICSVDLSIVPLDYENGRAIIFLEPGIRDNLGNTTVNCIVDTAQKSGFSISNSKYPR